VSAALFARKRTSSPSTRGSRPSVLPGYCVFVQVETKRLTLHAHCCRHLNRLATDPAMMLGPFSEKQAAGLPVTKEGLRTCLTCRPLRARGYGERRVVYKPGKAGLT